MPQSTHPYVPTRKGWLYLAVLVDLYSRRVVGWSMSDRQTVTLVVEAWRMAWQHRHPSANLLHHSDQGKQYTAGLYHTVPHGAHPAGRSTQFQSQGLLL